MVHVVYKGEYPNFCGGVLQVIYNRTQYICKRNAIVFMGGEWHINEEFLAKFDVETQRDILEKLKSQLPKKCCGGCL